jgi:hypothetical protein
MSVTDDDKVILAAFGLLGMRISPVARGVEREAIG